MTGSFRTGRAALWGVALAALLAPAARAQTAAEPGEKTAALEEIVVTADRRNSYGADLIQAGSFRGARQLDTPLTVSVIPQEVLQSQQAEGLFDALRNTAGVTSAQTSPVVYNNLSIRGIPVENRGNYRLNGSLPIVNLIDLPLEDKDRVEALKGASALYYGFTPPSGVINMTMKRPTQDPLLDVTYSGNDHGAMTGHVDAGGTYGMLGARLNVVDGRVDSGIDGTRGDRSLIAGAFDFKPLDSLTASLDFEHIDKQVTEPATWKLTQPKSTAANPYPSVTLPTLLDPSANFGPDWAVNHSAETNILGHVVWRFDEAWAATVDYGMSQEQRQRRFSYLTPTDLDSGDGLLNVGLQRTTYHNRNGRAELAGDVITGPFEHEVLIGASENIRDQFSPTSINIDCKGGISKTATPASCAQNFLDPRVIPETAYPASFNAATSRIDDTGYYAFDRIKYDEWFNLLIGLRQSDYTESVVGGAQTYHATPLSASYGAVVKPWAWLSFYGTYIEGLESTPAAPLTAANAGTTLAPSNSTQYEAGAKVEPWEGLLFQAAWFDIDRASAYVNNANIYVEDGRARYQGVEASLTGEVTRDLSVYASAQFLDAEQTSGPAGQTVAGVYSPTLVGKFIENTAHTTLSLAAEYRFTDLVPGLSVNGGAYYTGSRAINPLNQATVPAYTLFDLGAGYTTPIDGRPTTFRLNAENITGKRYWASTGSLSLAEGVPRTIRFSVGTSF